MKRLKGKVERVKMQKTATVEVTRFFKHPMYKKRVKRSKKYLVHNEIGVKEGDTVIIQECRPISKRKRFKIVEVIK